MDRTLDFILNAMILQFFFGIFRVQHPLSLSNSVSNIVFVLHVLFISYTYQISHVVATCTGGGWCRTNYACALRSKTPLGGSETFFADKDITLETSEGGTSCLYIFVLVLVLVLVLV
jgi:hypothetical protein